jgi:DNA-binding winged helix-turn-helix (wHTH) protein
MADSRVFAFGPFHYDAEQRLLFRQGEVVPLVPKAIDTLHALLERRGRVVEKAELMKLVWPDTTVEDVGLARNISLLRKALDDESGQYIETIPRRGYRFAAEAQGPGVASLAVIPFESLTYELDRSAFSRGLSDLLVANLSKLDRVQVISPSTVRRYTWLGISTGFMGRLLGLEVLVEGTLQRVGDRLTITARLVDVHTGKLIWAANYDYPAADWGQLQGEAARKVAAQVGAHLAIQGRFPRSDH